MESRNGNTVPGTDPAPDGAAGERAAKRPRACEPPSEIVAYKSVVRRHGAGSFEAIALLPAAVVAKLRAGGLSRRQLTQCLCNFSVSAHDMCRAISYEIESWSKVAHLIESSRDADADAAFQEARKLFRTQRVVAQGIDTELGYLMDPATWVDEEGGADDEKVQEFLDKWQCLATNRVCEYTQFGKCRRYNLDEEGSGSDSDGSGPFVRLDTLQEQEHHSLSVDFRVAESNLLGGHKDETIEIPDLMVTTNLYCAI